MNKPDWILEREKKGWTEVRQEGFPGYWIGLLPGGNGGVTSRLYAPPHLDPFFLGPLTEKMAIAAINSGRQDTAEIIEDSIFMARKLLKMIYED